MKIGIVVLTEMLVLIVVRVGVGMVASYQGLIVILVVRYRQG